MFRLVEVCQLGTQETKLLLDLHTKDPLLLYVIFLTYLQDSSQFPEEVSLDKDSNGIAPHRSSMKVFGRP